MVGDDSDECCLRLDSANYTTFPAVIKSLSGEIDLGKNLKSVADIPNKLNTSLKSKFHKTRENDVYMGLFVKQLYYPNTQSVRLTLEETTITGAGMGNVFSLVLYNSPAGEWQSHPALKSLPNKYGKTIIIFQNVTYQSKSGNLDFNLTNVKKSHARIWIKHFTCPRESGASDYDYITLAEAAKRMAQKFSVYAVVHAILKEPSLTNRGTCHAMLLLTDPSCYTNNVKTDEYVVHIFASSVESFPKVAVADVVRLHRVCTEARPRDGRPDFRVFQETAMVIFPWNENEAPRSPATQYTMTEKDIDEVRRLKQWSLDRYRQPPAVSAAPPEPKLVTLQDIKCDEQFNFVCRLVECFDEGAGVALWVEDGTLCPLLTCSDAVICPYDSQATQDVVNYCARVCIRCSKHLLAEDLKLESGQTLLYLRQVNPTVDNCSGADVVQFEVMGGVEPLPPCTRYHKALVRRLEKRVNQVEPDPGCAPILPRAQQASPQHASPPANRSPEVSIERSPRIVKETVVCSPQRAVRQSAAAVAGAILEPDQLNTGPIASSGESETERAMVAIPSQVMVDMANEAESKRRLVRENDSDDSEDFPSQLLVRSMARSQPLGSLEDITFSQVIASTQKPPARLEETDLSEEEEIPNAQKIPDSPCNVSPGPLSCQFDTPETRNLSPHPGFLAAQEVLEIRTKRASPLTSPSDPNTSINCSPFLSRQPEGDQLTPPCATPPRRGRAGRRTTLSSTYTVRSHSWNEDEKSGAVKAAKKRVHSQSSQGSGSDNDVSVVVESRPRYSQESDDESVVLLNPASQLDLERFYQAVEQAEPEGYIGSLAEADAIPPGDRFRVSTIINELLPRNASDKPVGLENLLVALCLECRHLWQYSHFKNSISQRARYRRRPTGSTPCQPGPFEDEGVINYLCSEERHDRNMKSLADDESPDLNAYDYDANAFIDRSYAFVCPMCKQRGLPDSLIQLELSFFFWFHLIQKDKSNKETCLHVMATGVHAEYFLGTKADHVARSPDVWSKAELRLAKLIGSQQPLTLCLRRSPVAPAEVYLENTYVVYSDNHLLPW